MIVKSPAAGFGPSHRKGLASIAVMAAALSLGTPMDGEMACTAASGSEGQEATPWVDFLESADAPLGMSAFPQFVRARQAVESVLAPQDIETSFKREIVQHALSFLASLAQADDFPNRITRPAVGGVGMAVSKNGREAFFEMRVSPMLGDRVQGVLFLTDYREPKKNQIRHLNREGLDEAGLVDQALAFLRT